MLREVLRPLAGAALLAGLSGCWGSATTTRIVDGRELDGRPISTAAYDAYARAAYLESKGHIQQAADAYALALDVDNGSPEIWTRYGSVLCRLESDDAMDAFEEALDADETYAPAHREAAECQRRREQWQAALNNARRAVSLAPLDVEANLLVATVLEHEGDTVEARRWLIALALRQPHNAKVAEHLRAYARKYDAGELLLWAPLDNPVGPQVPWTDIDAALQAGELQRARQIAMQHNQRPVDVALRALAVGALKPALEQARLVFRADPANADARIALLVAGLDLGDAAAVSLALTHATHSTPPTERAARLLAEELDSTVGPDAAQRFREAFARVQRDPPPKPAQPPLPPVPPRLRKPARPAAEAPERDSTPPRPDAEADGT